MKELEVLHVVTDDTVLARADFVDACTAVLQAGGDRMALHLRGPHTGGRALFDLAVELLPRARSAGATLLVNDRVDVARAAGIEGVHLGQRSLAVLDARALGSRTIGVSCHDVEEVHAARAARADYLLCGHVFETPSHPGLEPLGLEGLGRLVEAAGDCPVVAIGGVTPDRVGECLRSGARGVAVLSGIWGHDSPPAGVSEYISELSGERRRLV